MKLLIGIHNGPHVPGLQESWLWQAPPGCYPIAQEEDDITLTTTAVSGDLFEVALHRRGTKWPPLWACRVSRYLTDVKQLTLVFETRD